MYRVLIIGCSGSGKSTLAKRLGDAQNIPYIDTDSLYWREGWASVPAAEVVSMLPLDSSCWVIDGNFANHRREVWGCADSIVWLNYSRWRILWRVSARNLTWWIRGEQIWSENKMTLPRAVSGMRFAWRSYAQIRRTYPNFLNEFNNKNVHVFKSPKDAERWLAQFAVSPGQRE